MACYRITRCVFFLSLASWLCGGVGEHCLDSATCEMDFVDQGMSLLQLASKVQGPPLFTLNESSHMMERTSFTKNAQSMSNLKAGWRGDCPKGSPLFDLSTRSNGMGKTNFTKVVLADYPSTGSTWLRSLLSAVSKAHGVGNPSCSIYGNEGTCKFSDSTSIHCLCDGFKTDQDAALIKSHFPTQELAQDDPLNGEAYKATMNFDRIIHLVRHPVATVKSNMQRWSGGDVMFSENLHCWGEFWENVKTTAGSDKVLTLRYEDLCLRTAEKTYEVLQFIGGSFADISLASVDEAVRSQPDLACMYQEADLQEQMEVSPFTHQVVIDNADMMSKWGYAAT